MKKLTALIVVIIAVSGAFAEQSTKKPTKRIEAVKASPAVPVASTPAPSPPPPLPFAPTRWQTDTPIASYLQNEPDKVYAWVESLVGKIQGKPDQFSSEDERLSYQMRLASALQEAGSIPVVGSCGNKKYDPEKQIYKFDIQAHRADRESYAFSPNSPPRTRDLAELRAGFLYKVQDNWLKYGVVLSLKKSNLQQLNWIDFAKDAYIPDWFVGQFELEAQMTAVDARRDNESIKCLYVVELLPPGLIGYKSSGVRKVENKHVFGRLEAILVVNTASGETLTRVPRSATSSDRTPE